MKKLVATLLIISIFAGCEKENDDPPAPVVCDVKGTYVGTATRTSNSQTSPAFYQLRDDNFAVGTETLAGPGTSFGGYRSSCDSVIISVYYNVNSSYYLLKGALSSNKTVLSGTFNNLTTPADFGTFTMTKQ